MQLSNSKNPDRALDSQNQINWFQKTMGKVLDKMVSATAGAQAPGAQHQDYIPKATDSARVESIQSNLRGMAFRNDWTRVVLPGDDCGCGGKKSEHSIQAAQAKRLAAFRREAAMPQFSHYMATPTDKYRLNNPAQASFNSQPQLTVPNAHRQFYAFMHAMSAAFGSPDQ